MGKGDKKSRKGKIFAGSFGVRRPRHKGAGMSSATAEPTPVVEAAKPAPKKKGGAKAKASKK